MIGLRLPIIFFIKNDLISRCLTEKSGYIIVFYDAVLDRNTLP